MKQTTRRNFLKAGASLTAAAAVLGAMGGSMRLPRVWGQTAPGVIDPKRINRPNILLFLPDQHRFDWTGLNDRKIPVRTPNFEKLAGRGVRFTNAVVASPLCAPSRACLASGKEYARCGVRDNSENYPVGQRTIYRLLRDGGYHVMGCGKMDLSKASHDWGIDGKRLLPEWGFSDGINNSGKLDSQPAARVRPLKCPYLAYLSKQNQLETYLEDMQKRKGGMSYKYTAATPLPEDAYADNWEAGNGLDLLRGSPADRPWFLQVNFSGPHNPEDITRRMEGTVRGIANFPQPDENTEFGAATHVAIRQNYSAMVENVDRWLGVYVDELRKRGELDNTVIVYASDHGEMLGDHNRWGKEVPYHSSASVPMVFAGPGISAGGANGSLVSLMDLAATFLDFGGVDQPGDMDSKSLRPLLADQAAKHRDVCYSALRPWRMVWDGRYKLVHGFGAGAPVLFDLKNDPFENTNIAGKAGDVMERLKPLLA